MADMNATAREFLERTGLEPTLNRILVLSAIAGSDHPMTAREVHERVEEAHSLNRVTVYRILDLLAEKGVVNKVSAGERVWRYCGRHGRGPHGHSHFHCLRCGEVRCIDNETLSFNKDDLSLPMHVSRVDLRLDGICGECKAKE